MIILKTKARAKKQKQGQSKQSRAKTTKTRSKKQKQGPQTKSKGPKQKQGPTNNSKGQQTKARAKNKSQGPKTKAKAKKQKQAPTNESKGLLLLLLPANGGLDSRLQFLSCRRLRLLSQAIFLSVHSPPPDFGGTETACNTSDDRSRNWQLYIHTCKSWQRYMRAHNICS